MLRRICFRYSVEKIIALYEATERVAGAGRQKEIVSWVFVGMAPKDALPALFIERVSSKDKVFRLTIAGTAWSAHLSREPSSISSSERKDRRSIRSQPGAFAGSNALSQPVSAFVKGLRFFKDRKLEICDLGQNCSPSRCLPTVLRGHECA